jgi:hypothetical protein
MRNVSRGATVAIEVTYFVDLKALALHLHVVSASLVYSILGDFHFFEIPLKRCRLGCDVILDCAKTQVQLFFDEFRFL